MVVAACIPVRVKVAKILIRRAEGPSNLCGKWLEFKDYEAARFHLRFYDSTYPTEGYDKHDFTVFFEDGETYQGRLDVKYSGCGNCDQDIRQHMRDTLEFYAGLKKPRHMTDEQYQQALSYYPAGDQQACLDYFRKYDI